MLNYHQQIVFRQYCIFRCNIQFLYIHFLGFLLYIFFAALFYVFSIKEGYNLIISKSEKDKSLKEDRFYPSLEELLKIYKGWKIKYLQDFTEEEDHGNGSHKHNLIFFLAKND